MMLIKRLPNTCRIYRQNPPNCLFSALHSSFRAFIIALMSIHLLYNNIVLYSCRVRLQWNSVGDLELFSKHSLNQINMFWKLHTYGNVLYNSWSGILSESDFSGSCQLWLETGNCLFTKTKNKQQKCFFIILFTQEILTTEWQCYLGECMFCLKFFCLFLLLFYVFSCLHVFFYVL